MMPTRSRWRCARYARQAATKLPYSSLVTPLVPKLMDFETSNRMLRFVFVSASVLLDVVPIRARVQPPVDAPDVVAGDVAAVLGEVDGRAEERRAVQAVDEAFDDVARHQLEVADARKDLRDRRTGRRESLPG